MQISNIGYNPISKETENITEWLKNKDNLVFIIDGDDDKLPVCLKRGLFISNVVPNNYILHICDMNFSKYVKAIIKNDTTFIDIEKYHLIDSTAINYKHFAETVGSKQTFLITKINVAPLTLYNEDTVMNINKFYKTLFEYSKDNLYKEVTSHLLTGNKVDECVMKHIANLDQCFLEYAQLTNDEMVVYRGMKTPYDFSINESILMPNYLSTTTNDVQVVNKFQNYYYYKEKKNRHLKPEIMPPETNNCCIYEIKIESGIPYIDMKYSTNIASENEILFPRNLLITYTGEYMSIIPKRHIRKITVSKSTEGQFESIDKKQCTEFHQANISVVDVTFIDETVKKSLVESVRKIHSLPMNHRTVRRNSFSSAQTTRKSPRFSI